MAFLFKKAALPVVGISICMAAWLVATRPPRDSNQGDPLRITEKPLRPGISGKSRSTRHSRSAADASDNENGAVSDERLQEWLDQASLDRPGTLAKIIALTDMVERREVLDWVLSDWTVEDRGPALDWLKESLRTMPADPAEESIDLLIGPWAGEDPEQAKAWVEENIRPPWTNTGLQSIAETWANSDPEALGAWILQQDSPPDLWASELIQIYIQDDPARAMEWCDKLSTPETVGKARERVMQSWLTHSPGDADEYLREHPEIMRPEGRPEDTPPFR